MQQKRGLRRIWVGEWPKKGGECRRFLGLKRKSFQLNDP